MHGDFTGGVGSMAWLGLSTCRCVYMYVCSHAWALLQYMLPYAYRRRVEMHGDFTGGVGSMVWLGLASAGVGGRGGQIQVTVCI